MTSNTEPDPQTMRKLAVRKGPVVIDAYSNVLYTEITKKGHVAKGSVRQELDKNTAYAQPMKKAKAAKDFLWIREPMFTQLDNVTLYTQPMKKGRLAKEPIVTVPDNNALYAQPMKKGKAAKEMVVSDVENKTLCTQPMKKQVKKTVKKPRAPKKTQPLKVDEGIVYAELELKDCTTHPNQRPIIHGDEDITEYASIQYKV